MSRPSWTRQVADAASGVRLSIGATSVVQRHAELTVAALARQAGAVIGGMREHMRELGWATSRWREHVRELEQANGQLRERVWELEQENARLQALAARDSLTGLANRRAYDACWQREWRRALRHGTAISLLLIDIDRFKGYNDANGHAAGDTCLRQVAAVVGTVVHRPGDLAARYGGEEFVIVAAETPGAQAVRLAETVRARVEGLGIVHARSNVAPQVTVSVGLATTIPRQGDAPGALLAAADAALYAAKRAGGNRVQRGPLLDATGSTAAK